jgi:hypothetical protein
MAGALGNSDGYEKYSARATNWKNLFKPDQTSSTGCSYTIGASNGIFFGTGFFGCLTGWAGNRFGRVDGFRIAATTGIIGGALQCASQSPAMVRF